MAKVRVLLLGVVAVLSVGAVMAGSASAAIEFKWKVGGTELKSGETRGATSGGTDGTKTVIRGTIAGASILALATNVVVLPGATINGGVPGTGTGTSLFLGVTVDKESCTLGQNGGTGTIQTVPLRTEIVEGASSEKGNNEVDILTVPIAGTTYATFLFGGSPCLLQGAEASVSGSVVGLALPQKTEVLRGHVVGEAITKEYKNSAGVFKKAGLVLGGEPVTITGLGLAILNSDAVFGAF